MADQGFGGTVIGGIQDISALLPLLGTEQCEEHVGSALERGFLYSAVTPLSIFGSLGIVRAGFNILVASISIRKFRFLGAKELKNGGFNPKGDAAPMISFDRKHPRRFLAESQLELMLAEEHIQDAEYLTVSWAEGIFRWNFKLLVSSVVFASIGLVPYIGLIRDSTHPKGIPLLPSGWGFPILRVLGSSLCVIVPQFLIQMRILVILKTRLLFMTIDQYYSPDSPVTQVFSDFKKEKKHLWNEDLPSETCIWALQQWLSDLKSRSGNKNGLEQARHVYTLESLKHFGSTSTVFIAFLHCVLSFLLIVGVLLTIGGYVGCFYLVQHTSENSSSPLQWLGLEAALSIIRILIWALNPSWDDSKGVVFKLELAQHPPLITCTKSQMETVKDHDIPVARPYDFLAEVVAFTGPLKLVKWDNVKLYYVLGADTRLSTVNLEGAIPGILYIIVSNYEEQTSRLVRRGENGDLELFICTLVFGNDNTSINVKVNFNDGATEKETHSFTSDESAMQGLVSHYDEIMGMLSGRKKDTFGKTWGMLHPPVDERNPERPISSGQYLVSSILQIVLAPWRKLNKGNILEGSQDVEHGRVDDEAVAVAQPASQQRDIQANFTHEVQPPNGDVDERNVENQGTVQTDNDMHNEDKIQEPPSHITPPNPVYLLTKEDKVYLEQSLLENRHQDFCYRLEEWIELYVGQYCQELEDLPVTSVFEGKNPIWIRQERRLRELLVVYCQLLLEIFFQYTSEELNVLVETKHEQMIKQILTGTFGADGERSGREMKRRVKFAERLRREQIHLLKTWDETKSKRKQDRWAKCKERFTGLDGDDIEEGDLLRMTQGLVQELDSEFDFTAWDDVKEDMELELYLQLEPFGSKRHQSRYPGSELIDFQSLLQKNFEELSDHLVSRMKYQQKEYRDVSKRAQEILSNAPTPSHEKYYWSKKAFEERLRLMHKGEKYLLIFGQSIDNIGGIENMVRALAGSQPFIFVDFTSDLHPTSQEWTAQHIISVIEGVQSITGVFYLDKQLPKLECDKIQAAVDANIDAAIQAKHDVCSYIGIEVGCEYYGDPTKYLISDRYNKSSFITVTFWTLGPRDHFITLRYRFSEDSAGILGVTLNSHPLECAFKVSDDFVDQVILLPATQLNSIGSKNEFQIALLRNVPATGYSNHDYRIADITLPVRQVEVLSLSSVAQQAQSVSKFTSALKARVNHEAQS